VVKAEIHPEPSASAARAGDAVTAVNASELGIGGDSSRAAGDDRLEEGRASAASGGTASGNVESNAEGSAGSSNAAPVVDPGARAVVEALPVIRGETTTVSLAGLRNHSRATQAEFVAMRGRLIVLLNDAAGASGPRFTAEDDQPVAGELAGTAYLLDSAAEPTWELYLVFHRFGEHPFVAEGPARLIGAPATARLDPPRGWNRRR